MNDKQMCSPPQDICLVFYVNSYKNKLNLYYHFILSLIFMCLSKTLRYKMDLHYQMMPLGIKQPWKTSGIIYHKRVSLMTNT